MAKRTEVHRVLRPETESQECDDDCESCQECCMRYKVDTALGVVHMFLDALRPIPYHDSDEMGHSYVQRPLSPKEEAAYLAALNKLETYLDAPDS